MPCTAPCAAWLLHALLGGLEPCPWGRQDPRCCDKSTAGLEHPHGKGKQTHGCHHLSVSQSSPGTHSMCNIRVLTGHNITQNMGG